MARVCVRVCVKIDKVVYIKLCIHTHTQCCSGRTLVTDTDQKELDIGHGVLLEKVDKFCYLGDMLDTDGG